MGDTPITARGCHQARATAESLRGAGIAHIFASPMLRCMQTANEFSHVLGLPIKVEPAVMETMDERWYPVIPVCVLAFFSLFHSGQQSVSRVFFINCP